MKKLFSLAILAMLMATPLFLVSCGDDDDMLPEESETSKPTITSWTEPFHDNGGSVNAVKSYMASSMPRYSLVNETMGMSSTQLTYATGSFTEGVIYSFKSRFFDCGQALTKAKCTYRHISFYGKLHNILLQHRFDSESKQKITTQHSSHAA